MGTTYEQHRKFLEYVASGAKAELTGFVDARWRKEAMNCFADASLQRRYLQGFEDGKAKMLQEETVQS